MRIRSAGRLTVSPPIRAETKTPLSLLWIFRSSVSVSILIPSVIRKWARSREMSGSSSGMMRWLLWRTVTYDPR